MAKKRFKIKDKQGNVVDYDISSASITIDAEGKSLDIKLSELVSAIARAVKSVTFNGNSPTPDTNGNVNLGQQMQADWSESNTNWPSYVRNKPSFAQVATSGSYNDLTDKPTIPVGAVVDPELSDTSENAVQNKVVKAAIDRIQAAIDALTGTGDTTAAINTINEVATFLAGVTNNETLVGKLNELRTLINGKQDVISDLSSIRSGAAAGASAVQPAQMQSAIEEAVKNVPTGSVESVTVNGTKHTPDTQGDVNLGNIAGVKGDDGITPHIGQNGHWWVGPETDPANDTGIIAQGPAGSSVTDADLVIAQTPSGEGDVLGMGGARIIKSNVDLLFASLNRLYSKLANMAFWDAEDKTDAEPTPLDWSVPKVTVTITNNIGSGAVIKRNGVAVGGSLQVDMGDPLTLTIEAADGNELSNVAATVDGVATTLTEADGVYTLAIAHVNAAMAIAFNGSVVIAWSTAPKDDYIVGGNVVTYGMQQGRSIVTTNMCTTDGLIGSTPAVILSPAGYPYDTKVFTSTTSNSNPGKTTNCYFATGGKRYLNVKLILNETEQAVASNYDYKLAVGCWASNVINNSQADTFYSVKIDGGIGRVPYAAGNVSTYEWKIDLHTFATDNGKQAGDIVYIKFLLSRSQAGTTNGTDSRLWFDNFTLKYKFTDD